ncbi:amidohydrolase family protein [Sphingomonas sp.]|uniref:amidohydrolase family protein n=1 Tax=Sphingomonas sp. TaxID=28214 RepID=UPI0025F340F6|nr:amidohydrolase family protein [Sphingomonas sp.]
MSTMSKRGFLAGTAAALAVRSASHATTPDSARKRSYRRIATEEGFTIPEVDAAAAAANRATGGAGMPNNPAVREAFRNAAADLGEGRIAAMDAAGLDIALLSLGSPGVQNFPVEQARELAQLANDRVAAAVRAHPARFAALATVAPQDPEAAARELERAIGTLGLNGLLINSHTAGETLDAPRFTPILDALQALDVPLYIHPRDPLPSMRGLDLPGFNVGWGYGVEVGTHVLRLIAGGVFDRFPKLKIVIGHMGEMLPFYLDRIDNRYLWEWNFRGATPPLKLRPSDYFRRNIWVTTSGVNYWHPLRYTIDRVGIDRVLFAADYPYEDMARDVRAIERTPLSISEKRKLFDINASRLFRIA